MKHRPAPRHERLNTLAVKARLLAVIVVALPLAGCLGYLNTPYYRPAAPEGRLSRALQPATESVILFERQGVIIGLNTAPNSSNQLVATLSFEIPDNTSVQLQDQHLTLTLDSGETQTCALSGWTWTGPGRTAPFSSDSIMVGDSSAWRFGTGKGFAQTQRAAYFFNAALFPMAEQKFFHMALPGIRIDGIEHELPRVTLTLETEKIWTSLP